MRLATGPVSWGVDFAETPTNPPWEQVLDEIAASPLDALELGPVGYLPENAETLRGALEGRSLQAVGSFVFDDLHDPAQRPRVRDVATRACAAIAAAGGEVLVIIDRPSPARVATAGRSAAAERLAPAEWEQLLGSVVAVAEVAREVGLRPAVHPHAGGYVEFEDEVERLLADTDLDLCLDSGHLAYAGADPAAAIVAAGERLAHLHLKDVRGEVLAGVRERGEDFWSAIEQDRVPGSGSPLADVEASVAYLEGLTVEARGAR